MPVLAGPLKGQRFMARVLGVNPWLGRYEPANAERLLDLLEPGGVFYDIGANAGYFTLLGARAVGPEGHVVAIEPNPLNDRRLRRHVRVNGFADRVTVVTAACADRAGTLRFDGSGGTETGHVVDDGGIVVEAVTLDTLVFDRRLPPPSVLKIDVEGAELRVLEGAKRVLTTYAPRILLELHTPEMDRACPAFLRALGYTVSAFETWPGTDIPRGWIVARPPA